MSNYALPPASQYRMNRLSHHADLLEARHEARRHCHYPGPMTPAIAAHQAETAELARQAKIARAEVARIIRAHHKAVDARFWAA